MAFYRIRCNSILSPSPSSALQYQTHRENIMSLYLIHEECQIFVGWFVDSFLILVCACIVSLFNIETCCCSLSLSLVESPFDVRDVHVHLNIDSPSHRHRSFEFHGATDFHCYDTLNRLSLNNIRSRSLYQTIYYCYYYFHCSHFISFHFFISFHLAKHCRANGY